MKAVKAGVRPGEGAQRRLSAGWSDRIWVGKRRLPAEAGRRPAERGRGREGPMGRLSPNSIGAEPQPRAQGWGRVGSRNGQGASEGRRGRRSRHGPRLQEPGPQVGGMERAWEGCSSMIRISNSG